jgi:hypothetical protein
LHDTHNLYKIYVGVVKRHVIHCIRDEPKCRVPDDVFLHESARSHAALNHRMPNDPAYRDPNMYTRRRLVHPDTSKEEKTRVATTGARVTNK